MLLPCPNETLVLYFYILSSSFLLLLLFLYFSSILLLKLINFVGSYPIIQRNQNGCEYSLFSDEEEEEDSEAYTYVDCVENNHDHHFVADMIQEDDTFVSDFHNNVNHKNQSHVDVVMDSGQPVLEGKDDNNSTFDDDEQLYVLASAGSESEQDDADMVGEETPTRDADSVYDSLSNHSGPTSPVTLRPDKRVLVDNEDNIGDIEKDIKFSGDEKYLVFAPNRLESRKLQFQEKDDDDEIFGESCTVGSTSKSSSEWRSSIKDSGTEEPFSSSSRRSCPKWESYTMFQKYDEEMMFLDRISAQKLQETESLKSIQVCSRSISDRIVHKFTNASNKPLDIRRNPYHELEAAYVAQICLTWEALNWNYQNFQLKRASYRDFDRGCPAHVAQQFQQFLVLLQRYVENEPYEQGRRPEVYARMRLWAPGLLLVPEYRDSEEDQKDDGFGSRISSAAFLMIMEDGIRTFMNFLKADKEKPCQVLRDFFKRNRRGSVDPALLNLMKKVNKKKKMKQKDVRRARKCMKRRKLNVGEEMQILMGLIDLKVVSRVLRMTVLSEEQLHWCQEKMSKVRVSDGKLHRDSSVTFFPAH